jgi:N-acetylmuramoyl-L-alanine amidase
LTNTGGASEDTEVERAEFANRTDAHLCISIQVDGSDNADAAGVSTYFYGSEAHGVASSVGERFAGLVQREIVARTDLGDLRSHAKTFDILRRTRMPAVRIDVGYLTNLGDAARLAEPGFRDVVAEAVVVAVQRVYLDAESDAQTGVLRLSELRAALKR